MALDNKPADDNGKVIINSIGHNLTGRQIEIVFDYFIMNAVRLVFLNTKYLDRILSYVLSVTLRNKRRRYSALDHDEAIDTLVSSLFHLDENREISYNYLEYLRIERNIWIYNLKKFFVMSDSYNYMDNVYLYVLRCEKPRIAKLFELRAKSLNNKLCSVVELSKNYFNEFVRFKSIVAEQYINYSRQYAVSCRRKKKDISFDDLTQNQLLYIMRGLDKYDSSKGALTSYIRYWIYNAQNIENCSNVEVSLAYDIPYYQRKKISDGSRCELNYAQKIEDIDQDDCDYDVIASQLSPNPENVTIEERERERLLRLVKLNDPNGVYRLLNNIDEVFTQEDLSLMKSSS